MNTGIYDISPYRNIGHKAGSRNAFSNPNSPLKVRNIFQSSYRRRSQLHNKVSDILRSALSPPRRFKRSLLLSGHHSLAQSSNIAIFNSRFTCTVGEPRPVTPLTITYKNLAALKNRVNPIISKSSAERIAVFSKVWTMHWHFCNLRIALRDILNSFGISWPILRSACIA